MMSPTASLRFSWLRAKGRASFSSMDSRRGLSRRSAVALRPAPIEGYRMTRTTSMSLAGFALAFLVGGCAAPQISPFQFAARPVLQFASRQVPGVNPSTLFTDAQQTLVGLGYRLDRVDAGAGVMTTQPTVAKLDARSEGTRVTLSSSRRGRRVVEVRVVEGASGVRVHCRVSIQLLNTEVYRMFRHEAAGADIPNETPIDLDAASTTKQSTVWETARRDRPAERQILDAIVRQAGKMSR